MISLLRQACQTTGSHLLKSTPPKKNTLTIITRSSSHEIKNPLKPEVPMSKEEYLSSGNVVSFAEYEATIKPYALSDEQVKKAYRMYCNALYNGYEHSFKQVVTGTII